MEHTDEHSTRIGEAMTLKWQDPEYRARQGEKARVLKEMWADPDTRLRMTVAAENTAEMVKAFVTAEIDRRVLAPRRAQAEAARQARKTVAQVMSEQRKANHEKAKELRRQMQELRRRRKEQDVEVSRQLDRLRQQAKELEK